MSSAAAQLTSTKGKDGRPKYTFSFRNGWDFIRGVESKQYSVGCFAIETNGRVNYNLSITDNATQVTGSLRIAFIKNGMKVIVPKFPKYNKGEDAKTKYLHKDFSDLDASHVLASTASTTDDTYEMWIKVMDILRARLEKEIRKHTSTSTLGVVWNVPKNFVEFVLGRVKETVYDEEGNEQVVDEVDNPAEFFKQIGKPMVTFGPWAMYGEKGSEKEHVLSFGIKPSLVMHEKFLTATERAIQKAQEADKEARSSFASTFTPPPAPVVKPAPKKRVRVDEPAPVTAEEEAGEQPVKEKKPRVKKEKVDFTSDSEGEAPAKKAKKPRVVLPPPVTSDDEYAVETEEV